MDAAVVLIEVRQRSKIAQMPIELCSVVSNPAAMAGMVMSPQLRESPETANSSYRLRVKRFSAR